MFHRSKVITFHIRYTGMCILEGHNSLYWIYIKGVYWMKMYLLTVKLPIKRKCAYWIKMCLLNKNVSIDWKYTYWMKMCILKIHKHFGMNNGSYSFGNFFSTSSFSSFLETQETSEFSLKLLFVEPNKLGCVMWRILCPYTIAHKKPKNIIGLRTSYI